MDADRFPRLIRFLAETASRRRVARQAAAAGLGLLGLRGGAEIAAHDALIRCQKIDDKKKRKKCQKRARRHDDAHTTPQTFAFTGGQQTYTVPARGSLTVEVFGGEGGRGGDGVVGGEIGQLSPGVGGAGGFGSKVAASFPVAAGESLRIEVGGPGASGNQGGGGGFSGGARGEAGAAGGSGAGMGGGAGGGGGVSLILRNPDAPEPEIVVLAGGGGGGAGGGKGGKGGDGGIVARIICGGFAEDGDPGVASQDNLTNHGEGGAGSCAFGPPGSVVGLGSGGPGRVTLTFAFA